MKLTPLRRVHSRRSGSALIVAMLFLLVLGGMAASLVTLNGTFHKEHKRAREATKSFYVAEAGIQEAYANLVTGGDAQAKALVYPRSLGQGDFSVEQLYGMDDDSIIRLDRIRLRSVGDAGGGPVGVELMVWNVPTGFFRWGIFGEEWVDLDSNSMVDSYDSNDGPYPDDVEWVNDYGNVGSNGDINIDSNTSVYGDAMVGPIGVLDDDDPGVTIAGVAGSSQTLEAMPPIVVPAIAATGVFNAVSNTTLAAGDYHFTSFQISGNAQLTIQGPARLVLDDALVESNSEWVIDATNGPVEIYATGDFELRSNSTLQTVSGQARDVSIQITSSNLAASPATIALSSNAEFTGTIYAPNALLDLNSNFHLFGAIKARQARVRSNSDVHFDEDLLYDPNVPQVFERLSWRRLSAAEVEALGF